MNNDLISREEAMDVIKSLQITLGGENIFRPEAKASVLECLDFVPKVDAVEVVRCKDCIYKAIPSCCPGQITGFRITDDWYCPMGVKEGD